MSALVATMTLLAALSAEPPDDGVAALLDRAAAAYAEGMRQRDAGQGGQAAFRRAAQALEELDRRIGRNADRARLAGNAWLFAGDLPRAVLHYRLGLRLAPADPLLCECLQAARDQVVHSEGATLGHPPEEWRPGWLQRLGGRPWWRGAALVYLAGWGVAAWWYVRRTLGLLVAGASCIAGAAVVLLVLFAGRPPGGTRPVVVLARDGVLLRMGDGDAYPPWTETALNRGVEAELRHRRGDWLHIELAGGEVGWVHLRDAAVIDLPPDVPGHPSS